MAQRQMNEYLSETGSSRDPHNRLTFLHLPIHIRQIVYKFSGLTASSYNLNMSWLSAWPEKKYPDTTCRIHLCCERLWLKGHDLQKVDSTDEHEVWEIVNSGGFLEQCHDCRLMPLCSLLLVSKRISKEVTEVFYKTNQFAISLGHPFGFTRLWNMSGDCISSLRTLSITIDARQFRLEGRTWPLPTTPLNHQNPEGKQIVEKWTNLVHKLALHIKSQKLSLSIFFSALDMATVHAVLAPLFSLPTLADCAIWINLDPTGQRVLRHIPSFWKPPFFELSGQKLMGSVGLSSLVETTIKELTTTSTKDFKPFPYLRLPTELRLLILSYTSLIANEYIQWRPKRMKPDTRPAGREKEYPCCDWSFLGPDDEYICLDECDWNVNTTLVTANQCCNSCHIGRVPICLCSWHGQIYSTRCRCRELRHPLFSVSRQVRSDTIRVYYSHNRLIISPFGSQRLQYSYDFDWPAGNRHQKNKKTELSLYLAAIPCNALQYIRRLEWIIPALDKGWYICPKLPCWFDYLDTLDLMSYAMTLSGLTFSIIILQLPNSYEGEWYADPQDAPLIYEAHQEVLIPMRRLAEAGLKDFFVYALWEHWNHVDKINWEQRLEKLIMGNSYDSTKRGKPWEDAVTIAERR